MNSRTDAGEAERVDRRAWPRSTTLDASGMASGRLLPGRIARVIDLCRGGALIETDYRLLPGTLVELQLGEPTTRYRVRGRILRCYVTALDRERGIRYRGALAFEEQLVFEGGMRIPGGVVVSPRQDVESA